MSRCPNCSYVLVLLERRGKYKCAKCGKLFPRRAIDSRDFRSWSQRQKELDKTALMESIMLRKLELKKLKRELTLEERGALVSEREREYYAKNKERLSVYLKEYRKKNKERISELRKKYWKAYYPANREKVRAYHKERYLKNRDMYLAKQAEYEDKNKEKILERKRAYMASNREKINLAKRLYRAKTLLETRQRGRITYWRNKQKRLALAMLPPTHKFPK